MPVTTGGRRRSAGRVWVRILGAGFVLWATTFIVTMSTGNANLVPTLIFVGSFLVPVTFVAWLFERWRDQRITTELIATAFMVGGLLGVLGASVLEAYLLRPSPLLFLGVGLIEEAAKLGALVLVTRNLPKRNARDGILLGGTIGLGFAAFETTGYAFNALLTIQGMALTELVETELVRSITGPFGHGLWTAILGGVLFREAKDGSFRLRGSVLFTYVWVSLLHALWNYTHSIALVVTLMLTGTSWQNRLVSMGYLVQPTPQQIHLFTLLTFSLLAIVAALGLVSLQVTWHTARKRGRSGG